MSTNDTLREIRGQIAIHWRPSGLSAKVEKIKVIERIDAALAEPVSGGAVVMPERKACQSFPEATRAAAWGNAIAQSYNQALDDVAAINGGAVAGQSPAAILTAKGVSSQPLGSEFAAVLNDNLQDLLITDGKPARCEYCDGTGDVHRADGEWLGECPACTCKGGE